jgi:hypothetical protein
LLGNIVTSGYLTISATKISQVGQNASIRVPAVVFPVPGDPTKSWFRSTNGFALPDGRTLYLAGADKHEGAVEGDEEGTIETAMVNDLMSAALPDEVIMRKRFGKKENRPKALHRQIGGRGRAAAEVVASGEIPDFLESVLQDDVNATNKKRGF